MSCSFRTRKTPMANRILGIAPTVLLISALLLSAVSVSASAQDVWTERSVSVRARERAPLALAARVSARRARARVDGVGLHPNPTVDWERQESFAPNTQGQDLVRVTVPLDLSGRRDAARALEELSATDSEVAAQSIGLELAAQALSLFYELLALERRLALLNEAQAVLDEAARVLFSRQAAGEASGYERARLTLEVELGQSRLARATLARAVSREELAALLGGPATVPLSGDFEVEPPPSFDALVERATDAHPELRSLDARVAIATRARDASDWAWVPAFSVLAGYNRQDGLQVGHGYTVGVRMDVPLFDRGQGEQAEARAALSSLDEYGDALRLAVRAQLRAARARLEGAMAERARFDEATHEAAELLSRAASTGYQGGERSLLELLDARRAVLEVAERRLALDLAVRLADVELRRITGSL